MAGELSANSQTFDGSRVEFYQQNDNTIRVRLFDTAGGFIYQFIISSANWTSLKAALTAGGTSYTPACEIAPAGSDHTVVIA
jgi:hypothetical protein